jgi:ABC-2 type transport system permease protein
MTRFFAIFRKEVLQIRRDPLSVGILVLVPVLLLALYGYVLSFDVKHIPLGVLDEDRTPESRAFAADVVGNEYFDEARRLSRMDEADALLARGRVRAVLFLPKGFAESRARGEPVRLPVWLDAADANTASVTGGYLDALADRANREEAARSRIRPPPMVRLEPRIWFNPDLISARFLVPGLMGMLLMISATIATALSIVREKERMTIEQVAVSAVRPLELLLGKTLPYLLIGLMTAGLVLAAARVLFGVTVAGSWILLGGTTFVFLFAGLGLGLLISSLTRSQQMAFQVAILTSLLPSILLSGMVFPIRNMPLPVQALTTLVVPRYYVEALRGIMLKDASWTTVAPNLAAMAALGLLFTGLAARKLRRLL